MKNKAVDEEDSIYLCDCWNGRIQVISKQKLYVTRSFECHRYPECILLHAELLYVSTAIRVVVYAKDGELIQYLGNVVPSDGNDEGVIFRPRGMCIVQSRLYIVDHDKRVQVFV